MALGVLNNISAIYAQNNLANTQASLSKTLQQLSSGSRINSGADDAAVANRDPGQDAHAHPDPAICSDADVTCRPALIGDRETEVHLVVGGVDHGVGTED